MLSAVQALLLLAFCFAGVRLRPKFNPGNSAVVACGMIGATAMGVQNAHSRLVARTDVPNTVMTGNVTQVILDALDLFSRGVAVDIKTAARTRIAKMLPAIAAFGLGALAGARAYRNFGVWVLLLPAGGLAWLATHAWMRRNGVRKLAS